jgi:hypothetical protein
VIQKSDRLFYRTGLVASILLVSFFVCFSLFWLFLWSRYPRLYRENGPMENFQAGCLFVGMVFLLKGSWSATNPPRRILLLGIMLLYLTMLVREIDLRGSSLSWLHYWLHGGVRNIWLGSCWAVALILFLRNARPVWNEFRGWLREPAAGWLLLAGVGWILAAGIDKLKPFASSGGNLMAEELLEVNAAVAMLASATMPTFFKSRVAPDVLTEG